MPFRSTFPIQTCLYLVVAFHLYMRQNCLEHYLLTTHAYAFVCLCIQNTCDAVIINLSPWLPPIQSESFVHLEKEKMCAVDACYRRRRHQHHYRHHHHHRPSFSCCSLISHDEFPFFFHSHGFFLVTFQQLQNEKEKRKKWKIFC